MAANRVVADLVESGIYYFVQCLELYYLSSSENLSQLLLLAGHTIMSNLSIDSAEIAYPTTDTESEFDGPTRLGDLSTASQYNNEFDKSTTTSTSLPERHSEITFTSNCMQELVPGMCFEIKGIVPHTCERFSVNLVLNNTHRDIALHLNPRMPQNCVVRNSKHKKRWGKEEIASSVPFDLHRGNDFILHILVTDEGYLIAINGKHFASFGHRFPYQKVKGIEIRDVTDVEVDQIKISEYPVATPFYKPSCLIFETMTKNDVDSLVKSVIKNETPSNDFLPMPYYGRFEDRFTSGKELHILARIKILPHSFFINLQDSTRIWPHPNIPLHLNSRFGQINKKNVIIRNSWLNGKWDEEERCVTQDPHCFVPGGWFHLYIACHDEDYQIYLNDVLIAEYPFRINPNIVNTVLIQGDLRLARVFCRSLR
ncbi:galectin-8-like [Culicoides brevitarsis]|uniref:galectin-8-like n=1 Tax=Culicoides brevitarsis TaxID=469753 RepID=UPI00307B8292